MQMEGALAARLSAVDTVATDLDGTLLRSDGTVSPRTRRALRVAQAVGIRVVLATARPPRDVAALGRELSVHGVALCSNGALVYDLATGLLVEERALPGESARTLLKAIRGHYPDSAFALEVGLSYLEEQAFRCNVLRPAQMTIVPDLSAYDFPQAAKLMVWSAQRSAAELHAALLPVLSKGVSATTSGAGFVELAAEGIGKGAAFARLCAERGIERGRTLAIGDGPNDECMIRWAEVGVAVANAGSGLKAAADLVVGSNDEDGVASLIEGLVGLRRLTSGIQPMFDR
jgi:Cof subfamily protein (haloacid dehalogenase superfamily)